MGWLIALGILLILGCLPLGISGIYEASGPIARLLIGPVKLTVYPRKKKKKKASPAQQESPAAAVQTEQPAPEKKEGGKLTDFLPLVRVATDFLGDFRRKLRVKRFELLLCMAGGDPCDLAINYGRAWAAVGNLMPQLERLFVIKKRDVQVCCDFTQTSTTVYVRADITITLGRLLGLLLRYGWRALKEFLKITNKRKGGAVK